MKKVLFPLLIMAALSLAFGQTTKKQGAGGGWKVGDQVEAWVVADWYKATIIEIGSGPFAGDYKVQYTTPQGRTYQAYVTAKNIRASQEPPPTASDAAPRLGKYGIYSYGAPSNPPIYLGHFELMTGGKYRISRRSEGGYYGEGTYSYDATTHTIKWLSGPLKADGWGGEFSIERQGKTHKIRLRPTTIATNSTDSGK